MTPRVGAADWEGDVAESSIVDEWSFGNDEGAETPKVIFLARRQWKTPSGNENRSARWKRGRSPWGLAALVLFGRIASNAH